MQSRAIPCHLIEFDLMNSPSHPITSRVCLFCFYKIICRLKSFAIDFYPINNLMRVFFYDKQIFIISFYINLIYLIWFKFDSFFINLIVYKIYFSIEFVIHLNHCIKLHNILKVNSLHFIDYFTFQRSIQMFNVILYVSLVICFAKSFAKSLLTSMTTQLSDKTYFSHSWQ